MEAPLERKPKGVPRAVKMVLWPVVIVGLLLALCIPAQLNVREANRAAACLSRVKQIGRGLMQYEEDHGGAYPWRLGALDPNEGWRDLGVLFPKYISNVKSFICPSSGDSTSRLKKAFYARKSELEPLTTDDPRALVSYSYSHDARGGVWAGQQSTCVPWTTDADSTVRLLADKKAGVVMVKGFGHMSREGEPNGRNVLYRDGHVKWKVGGKAVDPDQESDVIGAPGAPDYRAWWSDPPYSGE